MPRISEGVYKVRISDAEWKLNSKGTGHYLKLSLTIMDDGDANGKEVYDYLNFDNPSEFCQKKAHERWVNLCTAAELGVVAFDWKKGPDLAAKRKFLHAEVFIDLFHEEADNGYVFYKIKRYIAIKIPEGEYPPENTPTNTQNVTERDSKDFSDLNDEIPF